jgi:hypothetical protein
LRKSSLRRRQPCRDATKPRHCEIASSIGAKAREVRIELAMMMPAVACWLMTSQAPMPSTADCNTMRNTFESPPRLAAMSAVRCWAAR